MTQGSPQVVPYRPVQVSLLRDISQKRAIGVILALSVVVLAFLFWLVYFKQAGGQQSKLINALPAVNATLNSLSTIFLSAGFVAIMRRAFKLHMTLMFCALVTSALFFVCYVIYHNAHGDTRFINYGPVRPWYFLVLISHITLSAVAVPLILASFYLSLSGRYALHKRVSRITFPIWLYVSVTGVLVFAMLKLLNHA